MSSANASNQEQIDYWNGRAGVRWASEQETLDYSLARFGQAALAAASPRAGERVLDIGCGAGATTLLLADAVGSSGSVLGVDISGPMLARARERAAALPNVKFIEADATLHTFEKHHDLLFSRFGVMFFANPSSAFANLRNGLKSGGRVSFVCWRQLSENPWMAVPIEAAVKIIGRPDEPSLPHAPGPLAFADGERVKNILESAGFARVQVEPFDGDFAYSARGLDHAVETSMRIGPAARLVAEASDEQRTRVRAGMRDALAAHVHGNDVTLPAATWIVTAHNP